MRVYIQAEGLRVLIKCHQNTKLISPNSASQPPNDDIKGTETMTVCVPTPMVWLCAPLLWVRTLLGSPGQELLQAVMGVPPAQCPAGTQQILAGSLTNESPSR